MDPISVFIMQVGKETDLGETHFLLGNNNAYIFVKKETKKSLVQS